MYTASVHYKKYYTKIRLAKTKLGKLEKNLSGERKELDKLYKAWVSGKERVRIAKQKAKASKSTTIKKRVNLVIEKQEHLSKQYRTKKAKVLKLIEATRTQRDEVKKISYEKNLYEKAMREHEKQWLNFYSHNVDSTKKKVATIDKVDFGMQLRAARTLLNLSVNEFCKLIDTPYSLLKQIEQPTNNMILESHLLKSIKNKLKKAGIELIDSGFYVGTGGIGVRISKTPSTSLISKPKDKKVKKSSTKRGKSKNKTRPITKKVA